MNRLLLLEDDLSLIDGLSCLLKRQGFDLDVARTVKEANAVIRPLKTLNKMSVTDIVNAQ